MNSSVGAFVAKRTDYQARADRNYEEKRRTQPKVSHFYVSDDDIVLLNELTEHFGESRKEVLVKAIHNLHELTFGKKTDNFS